MGSPSSASKYARLCFQANSFFADTRKRGDVNQRAVRINLKGGQGLARLDEYGERREREDNTFPPSISHTIVAPSERAINMWYPSFNIMPAAPTPSSSCYHFSIDDVFEWLVEVTDKDIPLFEHPHFALLKDQHEKYGTRVGLHLFFEKEMNRKLRSLKDVRDLRREIASAGGWLYFGPHALNYETAPYTQTPEDQMKTFDKIYREIDRFAGKGSYAQLVRLHYYSESYELASYFKKRGVAALFSTDRLAGSHRMPQEIKTSLFKAGTAAYQGMHFIRTHFRVEFFADDALNDPAIEKLFREALAQYGNVILYTHDYELARPEVRRALQVSFDILARLGIKSAETI